MGLTYDGWFPCPWEKWTTVEDDNDYTGDGKEVLSDGGTTITWTIPTDGQRGWWYNFPMDDGRER